VGHSRMRCGRDAAILEALSVLFVVKKVYAFDMHADRCETVFAGDVRFNWGLKLFAFQMRRGLWSRAIWSSPPDPSCGTPTRYYPARMAAGGRFSASLLDFDSYWHPRCPPRSREVFAPTTFRSSTITADPGLLPGHPRRSMPTWENWSPGGKPGRPKPTRNARLHAIWESLLMIWATAPPIYKARHWRRELGVGCRYSCRVGALAKDRANRKSYLAQFSIRLPRNRVGHWFDTVCPQ